MIQKHEAGRGARNTIRPGGGLARDIRRDILLYAMLLVPIGYFLLFKYGPLYGTLIAFKDYNLFKGVMASEWVGLDVFRKVFSYPDLMRAIRNTFVLNGLDLLIGFPAPILLALMLNELRSRRYKRVAQTILYMPHFLSWIIIGGLITQLFANEGLINSLVKGMGGRGQNFLGQRNSWLIIYTLSGVWQNAGWGTIIYLASITSISSDLYEAAQIDGAGRMRRIWHVTLPGIRPTIVTLLIMNVGRIASIGFERPFALENALVREWSEVISTYVYRIGIKSGNFSEATAVGLFQSVACMVFIIAANQVAERFGEQGIW